MDNQKFRRGFYKAAERIALRLDLVSKHLARQMVSSFISLSPVDTGKFVSNWQVGISTINPDTSSPIDPSGASALARAIAVIQAAPPYRRLFISNSVPYAMRLEFGYSQQAPRGIVRLTLLSLSVTEGIRATQ